MREHNIRHLPVVEHHKLVGIISDRDIMLMLGPEFNCPSEQALKVKDACINEAYTVDLAERLDNVLLYMAEHHIGSALVTKKGRLAGLFTVTDACRHFGEWLRSQFAPRGGNEVA